VWYDRVVGILYDEVDVVPVVVLLYDGVVGIDDLLVEFEERWEDNQREKG